MSQDITPEIGKWYIDGFCNTNIITPVKDEKYQLGIRWVTVKKCVSKEIAEIRVRHYNKNHGQYSCF